MTNSMTRDDGVAGVEATTGDDDALAVEIGGANNEVMIEVETGAASERYGIKEGKMVEGRADVDKNESESGATGMESIDALLLATWDGLLSRVKITAIATPSSTSSTTKMRTQTTRFLFRHNRFNLPSSHPPLSFLSSSISSSSAPLLSLYISESNPGANRLDDLIESGDDFSCIEIEVVERLCRS